MFQFSGDSGINGIGQCAKPADVQFFAINRNSNSVFTICELVDSGIPRSIVSLYFAVTGIQRVLAKSKVLLAAIKFITVSVVHNHIRGRVKQIAMQTSQLAANSRHRISIFGYAPTVLRDNREIFPINKNHLSFIRGNFNHIATNLKCVLGLADIIKSTMRMYFLIMLITVKGSIYRAGRLLATGHTISLRLNRIRAWVIFSVPALLPSLILCNLARRAIKLSIGGGVEHSTALVACFTSGYCWRLSHSFTSHSVYHRLASMSNNIYNKLSDALNKYVWPDDSQIVDLHIRKRFGTPPRIELRITEVLE
jgi:hypothetical protein